MRGLNTLSTAAGSLNLGDLEFVPAGHRVGVKGADSVETATLSVAVGGVNVFSGPLAVENSANAASSWHQLVTTFMVRDRSQMTATVGGTAAGCRVDFLIVAPGETAPWD